MDLKFYRNHFSGLLFLRLLRRDSRYIRAALIEVAAVIIKGLFAMA